MTTTLQRQEVQAAEVEDFNLRPALWLAGHVALTATAMVALLAVGIAHGVAPTGFAAALAGLLVLIALFGLDGIREHRRALLDQING